MAQHLDAFLVTVQLVRLNGGQSVSEHMLIIERIHLFAETLPELFRIAAHQGGCGPDVREIADVREPAAELAVFNLPVVDVPVNKTREIVELGHLPKGPQRHASGRSGLIKLGLGMRTVAVVPIRLGHPVIRTYA